MQARLMVGTHDFLEFQKDGFFRLGNREGDR